MAFLGACSSTPTPATESSIPLGTEAWGSDNCLYVYEGLFGWQKYAGGYCRVEVPDGVWSYLLGATVLSRVDTRDPQLTIYTDPATGVSWGVRTRDSADMILTESGWVPQNAFLRALESAEQQGQAPPPEAQAQGVAAGTSAAELQAMMFDVQIRVLNRILAPECVSSYNGCR